jgi:hypothetical protein
MIEQGSRIDIKNSREMGNSQNLFVSFGSQNILLTPTPHTLNSFELFRAKSRASILDRSLFTFHSSLLSIKAN